MLLMTPSKWKSIFVCVRPHPSWRSTFSLTGQSSIIDCHFLPISIDSTSALVSMHLFFFVFFCRRCCCCRCNRFWKGPKRKVESAQRKREAQRKEQFLQRNVSLPMKIEKRTRRIGEQVVQFGSKKVKRTSLRTHRGKENSAARCHRLRMTWILFLKKEENVSAGGKLHRLPFIRRPICCRRCNYFSAFSLFFGIFFFWLAAGRSQWKPIDPLNRIKKRYLDRW